MADVTISYNGSTIAEMSASGSKTLLTEGKFCEHDIGVTYVKPSIPVPTNMIANGDFSVAGATTDGWSATNPTRSNVVVSDGKLQLIRTASTNAQYGISYAVNTVAGHTYLIRFKVAKTEEDNDADARIIQFELGNANQIFATYRNLTKGTIIENVCACRADAANTALRIMFGGYVSISVNDHSMLDLYYIEMYDITDIIPS